VSVISGATNAVVATVTVGNLPLPPVFNPMNGDIYVPLDENRTLSIISGATNTVIATIPIDSYPSYPPAFDPLNGDVYVPCLGDGRVWVIFLAAPPTPLHR